MKRNHKHSLRCTGADKDVLLAAVVSIHKIFNKSTTWSGSQKDILFVERANNRALCERLQLYLNIKIGYCFSTVQRRRPTRQKLGSACRTKTVRSFRLQTMAWVNNGELGEIEVFGWYFDLNSNSSSMKHLLDGPGMPAATLTQGHKLQHECPLSSIDCCPMQVRQYVVVMRGGTRHTI